MRKEIENWWRQAEKDLEKAHWLSAGEHFDGTALYCQQAVEKALKALILRTTREKKIAGHSLVHLGKMAKVPARFLPGLRKLSGLVHKYANVFFCQAASASFSRRLAKSRRVNLH